jgi:TldD protein
LAAFWRVNILKVDNSNRINRRKFIAGSMKALTLTALASSGFLPPMDANAKEIVVDSFQADAEELYRILKIASHSTCDFADLFLEQRVSRHFRMVDRQMIAAQVQMSEGMGIRAVKDLETAFGCIDGFEKSSAKETAKAVRNFLDKGGEHPKIKVLNPKPDVIQGIVYAVKKLESTQDSIRLALMKQAVAAAHKTSNLIESVEVTYEDEVRKILIADNDGNYRFDYQPLIYFTVSVLASNGIARHRGRRRISLKSGMEMFDHSEGNLAAAQAAEESVQMLSAKGAVAGKYPVVLATGAGGVLFHEAVGHGLEGDAVYQKASYYYGKLNHRVASPTVTLIDDGQYPRARGSSNIDDEGTPTRKNILIENGVLKGFMTDRISAKQLGMPLSGNARRQSFHDVPLVRMTNTYLNPGHDSDDKIIRDTPEGLYCKSFTGGEVDTASGNFTFTVREAYYIDKGLLTHPVRGATLIGQGSEVLNAIDRVGSDFALFPGTCGKGQWVPVTFGQPTVRISAITVGGTD